MKRKLAILLTTMLGIIAVLFGSGCGCLRCGDWEGDHFHYYTARICDCGEENTTVKKYEFKLNDNSSYYILTNVNQGNIFDGLVYGADDTFGLHVPSYYKGKPVKEVSIGDSEDYSWQKVWISTPLERISEDSFKKKAINGDVYYKGSLEQWMQIEFGNEYANPLNRGAKLYVKNDQLVTEVNVNSSSVSNYAFYGASGITSVNISSNVVEIGDGVFGFCNDLQSFNVDVENPNYKTIDGNLYSKDGSVLIQYACAKTDEQFVVPSTVTQIKPFAFNGAKNLQSIEVNGSISEIGASTFYGCKNLKSITFVDGVQIIPQNAFSSLQKLESIQIPSTVQVIGADAFNGCENLARVDYLGTIDDWAQIDFVNETANPLYYADKLYINNDCVTEITLQTATKISDYAFYNYDCLVSISLSEDLTSIGNRAFNDCNGLIELAIPNNVTTIGEKAFYECSNLANISVPASVTSIGLQAFNAVAEYGEFIVDADNSNYKSVNNVLYSKDGTRLISCVYANGLWEFIATEDLVSIDAYAFANCLAIESVFIPETLTKVGENAFENTMLKRATLPAFALDSLYKKELEEVTIIGQGVIVDNFFTNCKKLIKVVLDDGITDIGQYAFYNCTSLAVINLGESVKTIGQYAFYNCTSLAVINLGESVKTIGKYAFLGCTDLREIVLPNSVEVLEEEAFGQCYSLESITFGSGIKIIPVGISKNNTSLKSVNIPTSVEELGRSAFENCLNLESVTLDCKIVGENAFFGCTKLSSLTIGENVKEIGKSAFENCRSLVTIDIPSSVDTLGENAFFGCIILSSLTIGENVKEIGKSAFENCQSLVTIDIPSSVDTLGESAFKNCYSLTNVTLGCKTVGRWTFYGCHEIRKLIIKQSVEKFDEPAFYYEYWSVVKIVYFTGTIDDWALIQKDNEFFWGRLIFVYDYVIQ